MSASGAQAQTGGMPDDEIQPMLARWITLRNTLGYVAAVQDGAEPRIFAAWRADAPDARTLDGNSVFEVGSITKVFTALLLADMAGRGEVALDDPVAMYLPPEGQPRTEGGQPITLLDLATHTSGLPRLPANLRPGDMANPYVDYTLAQLYDALAEQVPVAAPGVQFLYSNFGYGLLGHALARRAGQGFEELVLSRICTPLGMADTRISLTPSMRQRLVPGHNASLVAVPGWDMPSLPGLGALRSTANDLSIFLAACQGRRHGSLSAAIASLLTVRRQADPGSGLVAAEGWFVQSAHGDEVVWKDGGTGGYASFIGWSTRSQRGVVLLSNTANYVACQSVGMHLLNTAFPLPAVRSFLR